MTIDYAIPFTGKVLIRDDSTCFEECSFLENLLINRDLPFLCHFRLFANPNDPPRIYYRRRVLNYGDKSLDYLWLTHILPLRPKNLKQQLNGLGKIQGEILEQAKELDLDLVLTTGTDIFRPSLAEKFGFKLAFTATNRKNRFYIIDLKDQIANENYFDIYKVAFPSNKLVRKYADSHPLS